MVAPGPRSAEPSQVGRPLQVLGHAEYDVQQTAPRNIAFS